MGVVSINQHTDARPEIFTIGVGGVIYYVWHTTLVIGAFYYKSCIGYVIQVLHGLMVKLRCVFVWNNVYIRATGLQTNIGAYPLGGVGG